MGTRGNQVSVHFADKTLAGVPSLLADLQQLLDDKETADVVFTVGKEEISFHTHKLILWARCQNFKKYKHEFWSGGSSSQQRQGPLSFRYRHLDPDIFKEVLIYVYSGKIILQDNTVFSVLAVSQELGVLDLVTSCEEHIASTLSIHNACAFFAAAVQMDNEMKEMGHRSGQSSFARRCATFVEENAEQCVETEGWLELPKEALVKLLDSDEFALEEEDVWRAVLAWAKYHAGVPLEKPPAEWIEHEKNLICQALSGVIEYVKILLIDSDVFAEEVEPSGAVPMEMSLERYRYAAVPKKFSQSDDKRLRPRVSLKLFQGTEILTKDKLQFQRLLNTWYGEPKQVWRMLYRASRDGYAADTFHKLCDGHSPTFVVVMGITGNICGGFSDIPWTNKTPPRGRYTASEKTFLFTLVNNQGVSPTKFDVVNYKFATVHHPKFGPIFGAGADLCISDNCQVGMECYSNLPHSYGGDQASCSILMGDYNFNILDYEVFTTSDYR